MLFVILSFQNYDAKICEKVYGGNNREVTA